MAEQEGRPGNQPEGDQDAGQREPRTGVLPSVAGHVRNGTPVGSLPGANMPAAPTVAALREVNERLLIAGLREQELAETLEAERAQLAAILTSIDDAMVVVTPTGRPTHTNAAYNALFGTAHARGHTLPDEEGLWDRAARGESFFREFRAPTPDGALHWWEARGSPIAHGGGGVIVIRDVSAHKERETRLQHQASHDPLTGLPNRTLLLDRLDRLVRSIRRAGSPLALLFLDLDHFKEVNDTHGHQVGDRLLQEVAARMGRALRDSDTVARLGGDEFAVLLPGAGHAGALAAAATLRTMLNAAIVLDGQTLEVEASIGIALASARNADPHLLLQQADSAMYEAKRSGSGYAVYNADQRA